MKLSNIEIKNFKSFEHVNVNLNDFNVLIGACASGKSNFIEIFKFLQDISEDFERAISKHGGDYYLKNSKLNSNEHPCYIKASFVGSDYNNLIFPIFLGYNNDFSKDAFVVMTIKQITYELLFNFDNCNSYEILKEVVDFSCNFYKIEKEEEDRDLKDFIDDNHEISEGSVYINNCKGDINVELDENSNFFKVNDIIPDYLIKMAFQNIENVKKENRLLINSILSSTPISWSRLFKNINFYDFHPKLCKSMGLIGGEPFLTEQGDNLPVILDGILKNDEKRRKFINLLHNSLPYIDDIEVKKVIEERRVFSLFENYSDMELPAPLVSDGTTDIIALIVALYFEKGECVLIEEPERNIHPALLSKIVQMMKEVSHKKQVIITTHSPEILRSADLEDIFLISRDSEGFSTISKPINNEIVMPFIEELGIDEVFLDDYLELGND